MGFAERNGFVQEKAIQIDDMDKALRNRLYNAVHKFLEPSPFITDEYVEVITIKYTGNRSEGRML